MSFIYPGGDQQVTPNLGLATWAMDEVLAENMIIIDAAVGSGSSVQINGSVINNPNFNNTTPAAPSGNVNVTFQVSGSEVSAYVPIGSALTTVPSKILYVDNNRVDVYTANGTILFPFKTIMAAVNQIITNGDNSTFPYAIDIAPGANYTENITLNSTALFNVTFYARGFVGALSAEGQNSGVPGVNIQPASGLSLSSTTNNNQIALLQFQGINFLSGVTITNSTAHGTLGTAGVFFSNCLLGNNGVTPQTTTMSNIGNVGFFASTFGHGNTTILTNIGEFTYIDGDCNGGTVEIITNTSTAPFPNSTQWFGTTIFGVSGWSFNPQTFTVGAGSFVSIAYGNFSGTTTVQTGATLELSVLECDSNITVNSGGTLQLTGTTLTGTLTNNGTLTVLGTTESSVFNASTGFQIAGAATSGNYLRGNGTDFVSSAIQAGDLPSSVLINPMTTLGDTIYGGASGAPTRLAGNTTTTREFLTSAGVAGAATAPIWSALASGDIPNNAANTSGTSGGLSGTPSISITNLTVSGTTSFAAGSIAIAALSSDTITIDGDGTIFSATLPGSITLGGSGALSLNTQTANKGLFGPASGAAANPTFRSMVTADLPTVTPASGQGFWAGTALWGMPTLSLTSGVPGVLSANFVSVFGFYLPYPVTIKKLSVFISTAAGATAVCDAGLYPMSAGSTIVVGTNGGINGNSASAGQSVGLFTWNGSSYVSASSVTIAAGWYYLAWTQSVADTTMRVACFINTGSAEIAEIYQAEGASLQMMMLSSSAAATAGVLPSTLPALSTSATNMSCPGVLMTG